LTDLSLAYYTYFVTAVNVVYHHCNILRQRLLNVLRCSIEQRVTDVSIDRWRARFKECVCTEGRQL